MLTDLPLELDVFPPLATSNTRLLPAMGEEGTDGSLRGTTFFSEETSVRDVLWGFLNRVSGVPSPRKCLPIQCYEDSHTVD